MTSRSSPLGLGMAIRRLASSTISARSTVTLADPTATEGAPFIIYDKDTLPLRPRRAARILGRTSESFEAGDVDDEDDRSTNLNLEVFRHVEQTWLQGG